MSEDSLLKLFHNLQTNSVTGHRLFWTCTAVQFGQAKWRPGFEEPVTFDLRILQDYIQVWVEALQHGHILLLNVKKSPKLESEKSPSLPRFRGRKSLVASVQRNWPPRTFSCRFGSWSWNHCSMPCLPAVETENLQTWFDGFCLKVE